MALYQGLASEIVHRVQEAIDAETKRIVVEETEKAVEVASQRIREAVASTVTRTAATIRRDVRADLFEDRIVISVEFTESPPAR